MIAMWVGIRNPGISWKASGLVVLACAIVLRVVRLDARALWFDETVSVFFAAMPLDRALRVIAANDPHPPLYYLLLHAWIGLFGDSEAAIRSLSVLLSAPVVLLTWLVGRRLLGSVPALLAAGLVAVAPSQVAAGQEARMYGLLTLAAAGSWWTLWGALTVPRERARGGDRRRWVAYAVATAVMLYSHYYGFLVVASQAGYLVWRRTRAAEWRRAVYAWAGVAVALLPWWPSVVQQLAGGRAWPEHRIPLSAATLLDTLTAMTVGRPVLEPWGLRFPTMQTLGMSWPAVLGMAAAVALAAAAARNPKVQRGAVALLVAAALGPPALAFVISLGLHVYAPRYLLFIVPPVSLLIAAGAAALAANASRWVRTAALILPVLVVIPNAMGTLAFYRQPRLDVFDWRTISQTLASHARPDDAIVFLPGFSRIPVGYYLRGQHFQMVLTPDGEDVVGPGGARLPAVTATLAGHSRVWIVTVAPVSQALESLIRVLDRESYRVTRRLAVNMALLILVERDHPP